MPVLSRSDASHIAWQRYWCELGSSINCEDDDRGFLADPASKYGEYINPNVRKLDVLIADFGPLILCGEPGIGKSTELKTLIQTVRIRSDAVGGFVVSLSFRDISDIADFRRRTVESTAWHDWLAGSGLMSLIIDGVDEGLLRVPNFVNDLAGLLADVPTNRLRLVLTCRTAEWPSEAGTRLLGLWDLGDRKALFELCPLRRMDALTAATARGCDPEAFIHAVVEKRVTGLASRPITLFFLLNEFRTNKGSLPATHRELYEKGTRNLVREIDPARAELLRSLRKTEPWATDQQRLTAAQRIAAMLLCTGKSAVRRSDSAFETSLHSDLLMAECYEADRRGSRSVHVGALDEAIESALFSSLGEGRFGFIHQTVAECLASQHLAEMPLIQLRSLLCQRDSRGEYVVPQLAELSAWVTGYNTAFCEHVVAIDPEVLLRSDVAKHSNSMKEKLVSAVLSGAKDETIFDNLGFGRFLPGLDHPKLAEQLRPVVNDRGAGFVARRIAMSIAGRCAVKELCDDLLNITKSPQEEQHIREQALHALLEIIPAERLSELQPLAQGGIGTDSNDNIRGYALTAMIPVHWKIRHSIGCLGVPMNPNHIGAFQMLLRYHLPKHVEADDIVPLLIWLRDQHGCFDSHSSRHKLAVAVVVMALNRLDETAVLESFVQLWLALASRHQNHQLMRHEEIAKAFGESAVVRRAVAAALLNHPQVEADHVFRLLFGSHLLNDSTDFDTLLDQVLVAPPTKRANWAEAIRYSFNPQHIAPYWDKFLAAIEQAPELAARFESLRAWDVDEPMARKAKAEWLRNQRLHRRIQKEQEPAGVDLPVLKHQALTSARNSAPAAWYQLWAYFIKSMEPEQRSTWASDISSSPGWNNTSDEDKILAREAARHYLVHHAASHPDWAPGSNAAFAAKAAVWILRDLIEQDIAFREFIVGSWFELLGQPFAPDDDCECEWFSFLYSLDRAAATAAILKAAESDGNRMGHVFALRAAKNCWDDYLSEATKTFLLELANPNIIASGIDEWARTDVNAAISFAIAFLERNRPANGIYPIGLKKALVCCLNHSPAQTLDIALSLMADDEALAESVWLAVLQDHDLRTGSWYVSLSDRKLGELYLELSRLFPKAIDPPFSGGTVPPRHSAAEARDGIPMVLGARATESSCAELLRLAGLIPSEGTNLRWTYRNALASLRREAWRPHGPKHVLLLIENSDLRFIDSEQDLLNLVSESISRYQLHLTRQELPSVETLWNWSGNGQQRRDYRPRDEEALSDATARWLNDDLGGKSGVVINREVQPRRGSRTDIMVNAVAESNDRGETRKLTLVIEVKGCWHPDVKVAMHSQLVEGYLRTNGWRCGIYLVGWFVCERWTDSENRTGGATMLDAQTFMDGETARYDGIQQPETVRALVLDCRLMIESPSQR